MPIIQSIQSIQSMLTVEFFSIVMFFICFYGLIVSKNMIKSVIFLIMMEVAVIMFFLGIGFSPDALPPIGENLQNFENVADPLPQALMITAIVIGLSVSAVNIVMVITLFRRFKTTDWNTVKKLSKGESK